MNTPSPVRAFCFLIAFAMVAVAFGDDDASGFIPAALLEKVRRLFPEMTVNSVERDDGDGEKRWEVTVRPADSKLKTKVKLLEDATVTEVEEDVDEEGLPPAVLEAIKKLYPDGVFDEAVRRHRVEITYEVEIDSAEGKEKEIRLTRHGKILSVKND